MILSLYLILTFYDEVSVFMRIKSGERRRARSLVSDGNMMSACSHLTTIIQDKCGDNSKVSAGPQLPMSITGGERGNVCNVWQ